MEQHPVPRNITGFQFHLVGDMTLKQFGYLLGGGILGYIIIRLPFPSFIGWPVGITLMILGVALAFIPIQERPLDRWLIAFIKSVYSPTQFIWRKDNPAPAILLTHLATKSLKQTQLTAAHLNHFTDSRQKLNAYLARLPKSAKDTMDAQEKNHLNQTLSLFTSTTPYYQSVKPKTATSRSSSPIIPPRPASPPPPSPSPSPSPSVVNPLDKFWSGQMDSAYGQVGRILTTNTAKPARPTPDYQSVAVNTPPSKENALLSQLAKIQAELKNEQLSNQRLKENNQNYTQLLSEQNKLTQELATLRQALGDKSQAAVTPSVYAEVDTNQPPVKIIKPNIASQMGFPNLPTYPNIITGVVKDSNNSLLANILATIKDKQGLPVRALKTNKLGLFAASTPLSSGTYTIEFEDPQKQYSFAIIQVTLTNSIFTPLEIIAKNQKEVERERLMKEIFGK